MIDSFPFPFGSIPRNSRILIYGLGAVGKEYIKQIENTSYCKIVAVSDKNSLANDDGYMYVTPREIVNVECDYIVIANGSLIASAEILQMLLYLGVPSNRIIGGKLNFDERMKDDACLDRDALRIAVKLCGGLGDYVVLLSLVRKLHEMEKSAYLDVYGNKAYLDALFANEDYVHRLCASNEIQSSLYRIYSQNDVLVQVDHFPIFFMHNEESVREKAPNLYGYINKSMNDIRISDLYIKSSDFLTVYHRAHLFKQNRYQFLGQGDIWKIGVKDSCLEVDDEYQKDYESLCLGDKYITINCGASSIAGGPQTKVWPLGYNEQLIDMIHGKYRGAKIVQVGDKYAPTINGADERVLDADLRVVKHILRNAIMHIDSEGGLVHMATQLGTKCVVLFGPTPVEYYGYPQNINIVSTECSNCCHVTPNWFTTCILEDKEPRCMKSITPEMVMERVDEYLRGEGFEEAGIN